jgi:hypothetical protein
MAAAVFSRFGSGAVAGSGFTAGWGVGFGAGCDAPGVVGLAGVAWPVAGLPGAGAAGWAAGARRPDVRSKVTQKTRTARESKKRTGNRKVWTSADEWLGTPGAERARRRVLPSPQDDAGGLAVAKPFSILPAGGDSR